MKKISACLITLNEEKHLARALQSLIWVDEILIVDAHSKDQTRAIALDPKAPWAGKVKWLERAWSGFKAQRNFAMESASNDWILVVDADECVTPELANKIQTLLAQDHPHPAWKVRRQEYFLGKKINYGVWNPSYQDRFFNRQGVQYVNDIHEYPVFPVKADRIHEPILHSPDFAPEYFLYKMNKYTSIEAKNRVDAGQRTNWFHMIFAGPAMFLKNYFYYRAWKDGIHGVAISVLEGVSRSVRHIKIWQYQREIEQKRSSR